MTPTVERANRNVGGLQNLCSTSIGNQGDLHLFLFLSHSFAFFPFAAAYMLITATLNIPPKKHAAHVSHHQHPPVAFSSNDARHPSEKSRMLARKRKELLLAMYHLHFFRRPPKQKKTLKDKRGD